MLPGCCKGRQPACMPPICRPLEKLLHRRAICAARITLCAAVRAEYKRMLAHLRQPGASLSIIPEGIAGIFLASDQAAERIFLSRRKGFIKLAIQGGAGALGP